MYTKNLVFMYNGTAYNMNFYFKMTLNVATGNSDFSVGEKCTFFTL
jgi:hypothetical protein